MSELKINTLANASKINTKPSPLNEKSNASKTEKSDNTAAKVVLSGLAAAGAIGAAIVAIRKGMASKVLKEIGVDKFKEAGNKFVKGKAFTAKGQPFTGVITQVTKNGTKNQMHYVDGVLREVKSSSIIKATTGKIVNLPLSKKAYNYTEAGKLKSVDEFSWMHLNTIDPKQHGFQYVKTSSTNLDEKRVKGLKEYSKKQAEALEKAKIERAENWKNNASEKIEQTRQQLSQTRDINADSINQSFNNFEKNKELSELKDYFGNLQEQSIKENVSKLKDKMHTKPEINAQKIDEQFAQNKGLNGLNEYYRGLEQKEQNIKENVSKLKEHMHTKPEINAQTIDRQFENAGMKGLQEHFALEEKFAPRVNGINNRLKKHLTPEQYEASKVTADRVSSLPQAPNMDRKLADAIIVRNKLGFPGGHVAVDSKTGELVVTLKSNKQKIHFENGKWTEKDIKNFKDTWSKLGERLDMIPENATVRISKDGTFSIAAKDTKTVLSGASKDQYKLYARNAKGKYELSTRVTNGKVNDPVDKALWSEKTVEHLDNGLTKVTYSDKQGLYSSGDESLTLIRDKKGNILEVIRDNRGFGDRPHTQKAVLVRNNDKVAEPLRRLYNYRSNFDISAARMRFKNEFPDCNIKAFDRVIELLKNDSNLTYDYKKISMCAKALSEGHISPDKLADFMRRLESRNVKNYDEMRSMISYYLQEIESYHMQQTQSRMSQMLYS